MSFKTGIIRTTSITGDFIDPSNVVYESDWRTLQSDGSVHQVDTNVQLLLAAGERYLFYILTPGYAGPSGTSNKQKPRDGTSGRTRTS